MFESDDRSNSWAHLHPHNRDPGFSMLDAGSKILIVIVIVTLSPHLPHPCSSVVYFPCLFIPNSSFLIGAPQRAYPSPL